MMENLPTNVNFELRETTLELGQPIRFDLHHIFNEFPSLDFATVYAKVDYVLFPLNHDEFWFYIDSPQIRAPDNVCYTLARAKRERGVPVVFTDTLPAGDSFSSCHRFSHKSAVLELQIYNLLTRAPLRIVWTAQVTLIIPQQ
jgi:hypothetical protein